MKLLIVLAGIVVIAAGIAWRIGAKQQPRQAEDVPAQTRGAPSIAGEFPRSIAANSAEEADIRSADKPELATNVPAPPPLPLDAAMPAWEQQLNSAGSDPGKNEAARARAIFAMLPALPEEALAAAAERAVEQLPDADYAGAVLPVVTNARTHGRVMSVLFSDLMERPDAIALPTLLQIARNSEHAFAPSARDNLRLLLDADFGTDWVRWEAEIQGALVRAKR